jgi:phospholipid transport system substrate-binding protein
MKRLFLFLIFTILFTVCNANAGEPLKILKEKIDQVFVILNDPVYSNGTKKDEQRETLWKTIENAFDFNVMSRLTLANNWKSFTPEQKDEFASVFGRFLGDTYLDKIQSGFSGQQVEYAGEDIISDTKAVVMTNIIRNGVKTPMDYSMLNNGKTWKIYDVKIEGVSLLKNYRTQFRSILIRDKPAELIEMLKKKIKKQ